MGSHAHGGWACLRAREKKARGRARFSQSRVAPMVSHKNHENGKRGELFMYDLCLSISRI